MPESKKPNEPSDENSHQDQILTVFKNIFGSWVHSYHHDTRLETIRLISKDRSLVKVIPAHEFPEA